MAETQRSDISPELTLNVMEALSPLRPRLSVRLVKALLMITMADGELIVSDLAAALGIAQGDTSRQVEKLREMGLVNPVRDGNRVVLWLTPLGRQFTQRVFRT